MTYAEVRAQVEAALRRSPPVPAVLDLADGGRVVVDAPEQIDLRPDAAAVRRGNGPAVFLLDYDQVARVVPLDQLPGENGGLGYGDFYAAVRPLLWAEPYQPFALELRDGRTLPIDRPGRLALAGRFGVFVPPAAAPAIPFTYDQVARVIPPVPHGQADHAA
ncbi:MAG: hypothetical protein C0501_06870 [Isosphaera sp.]|nr:hypothetical protein [Isosphaera sp.]